MAISEKACKAEKYLASPNHIGGGNNNILYLAIDLGEQSPDLFFDIEGQLMETESQGMMGRHRYGCGNTATCFSGSMRIIGISRSEKKAMKERK